MVPERGPETDTRPRISSRMAGRVYAHHFKKTVDVNGSPQQVFHELDDHERLAAHMMRSSAMMGGSRMHYEFDDAKGRALGSRIRMFGNMLGIKLDVSEVVTERDPPNNKTWETVGQPRLLVIGDYRMGFRVDQCGNTSRLTVFIDYDDPPGLSSVLGRLLGPAYARWCTVNMAEGAAAALRHSTAAH